MPDTLIPDIIRSLHRRSHGYAFNALAQSDYNDLDLELIKNPNRFKKELSVWMEASDTLTSDKALMLKKLMELDFGSSREFAYFSDEEALGHLCLATEFPQLREEALQKLGTTVARKIDEWKQLRQTPDGRTHSALIQKRADASVKEQGRWGQQLKRIDEPMWQATGCFWELEAFLLDRSWSQPSSMELRRDALVVSENEKIKERFAGFLARNKNSLIPVLPRRALVLTEFFPENPIHAALQGFAQATSPAERLITNFFQRAQPAYFCFDAPENTSPENLLRLYQQAPFYFEEDLENWMSNPLLREGQKAKVVAALLAVDYERFDLEVGFPLEVTLKHLEMALQLPALKALAQERLQALIETNGFGNFSNTKRRAALPHDYNNVLSRTKFGQSLKSFGNRRVAALGALLETFSWMEGEATFSQRHLRRNLSLVQTCAKTKRLLAARCQTPTGRERSECWGRLLASHQAVANLSCPYAQVSRNAMEERVSSQADAALLGDVHARYAKKETENFKNAQEWLGDVSLCLLNTSLLRSRSQRSACLLGGLEAAQKLLEAGDWKTAQELSSKLGETERVYPKVLERARLVIALAELKQLEGTPHPTLHQEQKVEPSEFQNQR